MSILACKVCPLKYLYFFKPIHLNTVPTMQKHEYALDGKNLGLEAASQHKCFSPEHEDERVRMKRTNKRSSWNFKDGP